MNEFDALKAINSSALDAVRQLQENSALSAIRELQVSSAITASLKLETTGVFAAVRELQSTLNAVKSSMGGATAALEEYRKIVAPISESVKAMNIAYAPIFEQTRVFDSLNIKKLVAGLQTSSAAMSTISGLKLSGIASIIDALPKYDFLSDMVSDNFSVADAEELYKNGEITQDDINEEISEIVSEKQFSPKVEWDKVKKSKWFLAIKILIVLVTFVCNPVTEYATDKALNELGINEFWENSGVYDLIDSIFGAGEDSTMSETEAKETVDKTKTGNISKLRREDLLAKIKEIRTFISSTPQDKNTENLLQYLSELEKDVNGKKYGLVFEEHREEIDEVLATHTPVLTENKDLFINNGGEMNFLIEGDNLASLKLLEKTHKGKIDLIYIDPPYNTGNKDFVYDDHYVNSDDEYIHSKWLSFIRNRLHIAKKLLSTVGLCFISIDDHEQANLKLLADSVFGEASFIGMLCIETSNGIFGLKAKHANKTIVKSKDYVLVYSLFPENMKFSPLYAQSKRKFDTHFTFYKDGDFECSLNAWLKSIDLLNEKAKFIGVKNNINNLDYLMSIFEEINDLILDNADKIYRIRDYTLKIDEKYMDDINNQKKVLINGNYVFKNSDGKLLYLYPFSQLVNITDDYIPQKCSSVIVGDLWKGYNEDMGNIGKEGDITFPNGKKPVRLIKNILKTSNNKYATVLDFFAGSGTTGHAVMKLNAEDGGNRKFILCTNNENNICQDITYERIKRVIDKENYSASLKYYKVDYIPISERMYYEYADELLLHIRELVELENGVNFTNNAKIGIVLTEEELDEFITNVDEFAKCKKLYMGHDLLPSDEQERILKSREIEISIIPDYYYKDLQEG